MLIDEILHRPTGGMKEPCWLAIGRYSVAKVPRGVRFLVGIS